MKFQRARRVHLSCHLWYGALWFGATAVLAAAALIPALGQDPPRADANASAAPVAAGEAAAAISAAAASAAATKPERPLKPQARDASVAPAKSAADPPTGIAGQCANLLKLATTLKAEVDKTTKDVLSVTVVRDAGRIQQLAHKMRNGRGR